MHKFSGRTHHVVGVLVVFMLGWATGTAAMLLETKFARPAETSQKPAEVAAPRKPIMFVFTADWCSACQRDKVTVDKAERAGVHVVRVDVDIHRALAAKYRVNLIPTYVVISGKHLLVRTNNVALAIKTAKNWKGHDASK